MGSILGPAVTGVLFVFIVCLIILWILSIIWAGRDAITRGFNNKLAMLISVIPFIGVISYILIRPTITTADKVEQEIDISLKKRQLSKIGKCSNCGQEIEEDFIACPKCQSKIREKCSYCGRALDFDWRSCPYCGNPKDISESFSNSSSEDETNNYGNTLGDDFDFEDSNTSKRPSHASKI